MVDQNILGIPVEEQTKKEVLDKIKKYLETPSENRSEFFHIVSLNPEILVSASENEKFKRIIRSAQIRIRDGAGIGLAGAILGLKTGERFTGVELVEELLKYASSSERPVLLIGGLPKVAESLAECYSQKFPSGTYLGFEGYKNIKKPTPQEEEAVLSIIHDRTPQIVLAAFNSPDTEMWLYEHRDELKGVVCASVGGAFNYLSGSVRRPPFFIRKIGMEWFWRLVTQPWRWKRQLRLIKFGYLVFRQKLGV